MTGAVTPLVLLFNAGPGYWAPVAFIPISHILIDYTKCRWLGWERLCQKNEKYVFLLDQAAHVIIIIFVALYYATKAPVAYSTVQFHFQYIYLALNLGAPIHKLIQIACLFLFLGKPTGVFIQSIIKSDDENDANSSVIIRKEQKAGRLIGIFERYLAVILVITEQYSALAFIVTAKSIARFNKISDNPEFAERYLLGTLGSVLFAVAGAVMYLQLP